MNTEPKTRPIIFSGSMVRAILDGRKTQTRRVGKDQEHKLVGEDECGWFWQTPIRSEGIVFMDRVHVRCPYGEPGDRLWGRETWGLWDTSPSDGPHGAQVFHKANDELRYELRNQLWRPSIHMPRWASRITLEVISVRVERVQDISDSDIEREGVSVENLECTYHGRRVLFKQLWDSINAKRGFGWDVNPWVWVVEFKKIEQPAVP